MKNIIKLNLFIISLLLLPEAVFAFTPKEEFPKIANYYLQPNVPKEHFKPLAKYDLLIFDVDTQTIDKTLFTTIKNINPEVQFFAYLPSQSVNVADLGEWARFRRMTYKKVNDNNWWLYDSHGNIVYFSNIWPTIRFVDVGKGWNNYLSSLAADDVIDRGIWDGIFYDMVFANLSWLNYGNVDINRDGRPDSTTEVNQYWERNMKDLMKKTRDKIGDYPLVINVDQGEYYQKDVNGIMLESFPVRWLGPDSWSILMNRYVNEFPKNSINPQIMIINSTNNNYNNSNNFKKMRFGLTSTLLGDGYYTFDSGDEEHAQVWWYDEFDENLGKAETRAYNINDKDRININAGVWRRDFENGVSLVNSSPREETIIFSKEVFEKINGEQDRLVNNGIKINWLKLPAEDGVVLLKINNDIIGVSFNNGSFVRIFNQDGSQERNGFYSYKDQYEPNTDVLIDDIDNDSEEETLVNKDGVITVYKKGKIIASFSPYDGRFRGKITYTVSDLNGDRTKEIITGAGLGGGPHVRIFSKEGKLLTGGFFAYNKGFRGGVNVAAIDLNGDGTKEIITGAGPGGGPHVRIFSKDGRPLTGGWFAYNNNFRGGVTVAVGDVLGNGEREIITGAGPGGGPHVRIYSKDGRHLNDFFAYDADHRAGVRVMADDIDGDYVDEVLVSTVSF